MQKKLLTMAVAGALAVPAAAFAQVTVFGTMDGAIRQQSKIVTATGTDSQLSIPADLRTTNRWGLRGSEDMGGGLMANFWLEGQYATDTGAMGSGPTTVTSGTNTAASINANQGIFQRKAVVGLSKGGNSVDIGRDYTVNFKAQGIYDPMSYTYTGIAPTAGTNVAGTRSNNLITAGFRFGSGGVRVDYALGEVVGESWGTRTGFMGDFAFGPVTIAGAFSTQTNTTDTTDTDTWNIGGVYRMGAFTFRAGMSSTEAETAGVKTETPMWMLGVQYAISPTLNGRVGYYNTTTEVAGTETAKSKLAIVALDYILSKRTTAYLVFDSRDLSGTAAPGTVGTLADGARGIGAGIAHSF